MFVDFEDQLSDPFGCTYLSLLDESERDLISIKKTVRADCFLQKENKDNLSEFVYVNRLNDNIYLSKGEYILPNKEVETAIKTETLR